MTDNEPLHGMYDPTQHGKVFEMANGMLICDPVILAGLREQKLPYAIVNAGGDTLVWTTREAYKKVEHLSTAQQNLQSFSVVFSAKNNTIAPWGEAMTRTPLAATAQQAEIAPAMGHDGLEWPHTMDGMAWAIEFNKRFPSVQVDDALGWFCNAIMCGYDTHTTSHPKELDAAMQERNGCS